METRAQPMKTHHAITLVPTGPSVAKSSQSRRVGSVKSRRDMQEMLEKGIADGLFVRTINIDLAITVLYYTVSAVTDRKDMYLPEGMSERQAFVQIVSTFFRGISTAEGMRLIDECLERYDPARPGN